MDKFRRCLEKVLVHEGGFVNHPADPGGATNRGVTQRVYDAYRERHNLSKQSVAKITEEEVEDIYRYQYWRLIDGDILPPGVDYVVFDGAVNSGVSQSIKWLQRALGDSSASRVDGVLGPMTLDAVINYADHDELIAQICDRRLTFLKALKTWKVFGKGWAARVSQVRAVGQAWATGSVAPETQYVPGGSAKGHVSDAKAAPVKAVADAAAGGGTLTAVLSQAIEQLTPLSSNPAIGKVVAVLTVVGVVTMVGGFLYRQYAQRREARILDALDLRSA